MKPWKIVGSLAAITLAVAIGAAVGGSANVQWNNAMNISTVEFVTIVLSALSVILAILTIFLGIFAFIGWRSINEGVRDHSLTYLNEELQEGRPMFNLIRNAVVTAMYEGVQRAEEDEDFQDEADEGVEATQ